MEIIQKLSAKNNEGKFLKPIRQEQLPPEIKDENKSAFDEKEFFNDLWPHQEEAVKIFLEKKRGILEMATGTGKTRVAIEIIAQLFKYKLINQFIICTLWN